MVTPHEEGATDLEAEVAKLMKLPEVQRGHLAYWYSPTDCGWEARFGPCQSKTDIVTWVYRWGPDGMGICKSGLREIPRYERDCTAAFEVVEYIRSHGYWFCLFDQRETPDSWRASFCAIGVPQTSIDGIAGSIPTSICLAALKVASVWDATEQAVRFVQGHIE